MFFFPLRYPITTRTLLVCPLVEEFCIDTTVPHLCSKALNTKASPVKLFAAVYLCDYF